MKCTGCFEYVGNRKILIIYVVKYFNNRKTVA